MDRLVAAVDVGTSSARAGILDARGKLLGRHEQPIEMHRPAVDFAEHDSEQVWNAVCAAMRGALQAASADPADIAGISFDATCSLVVRDALGRQLSVSPGGEARWDTIVWLDHRALNEAGECTRSGHAVLDFIGGVMSPEMETPKLMWLKRHMPATWSQAGYFFDLADFLTWKASGSAERSQCTLTSKWTFMGHQQHGWCHDFFAAVGIPDMIDRGRLPERASPIGKDLGPLTPQAARELGLSTSCHVGVGIIDAHAGTLALLGEFAADPTGMDRHLSLIGGTSSCLMALSPTQRATPGIWGPCYGVVVPGLWVNEGGQSVTGALLDHVIRGHGAGGEPNAAMHARVVARVQQLRLAEGGDFADRLHVLPDFHGNRSPLGDPHARGVISGLTLDASFDGLCRLYYRTAVAIALGVRHILDVLNARGFAIDTLHISGGHVNNPLLMELYADATGCTLDVPLAEDTMLLGTAMIAATAAGLYPDLMLACAAMRRGSRKTDPNPRQRARFNRDYRVFLKMHEQRRALEALP
jgi:FGGY-family pentulose kinase